MQSTLFLNFFNPSNWSDSLSNLRQQLISFAQIFGKGKGWKKGNLRISCVPSFAVLPFFSLASLFSPCLSFFLVIPTAIELSLSELKQGMERRGWDTQRKHFVQFCNFHIQMKLYFTHCPCLTSATLQQAVTPRGCTSHAMVRKLGEPQSNPRFWARVATPKGRLETDILLFQVGCPYKEGREQISRIGCNCLFKLSNKNAAFYFPILCHMRLLWGDICTMISVDDFSGEENAKILLPEQG